MGAVQQSGIITPGHLVTWTTDGVVQDGGALNASQKVLSAFFDADFNSVGDQPLLLSPSITAFQLTGIIVTNASVSLNAAVGGFYTAASKGGSQIVANSQAYSALTTPNVLVQPSLTAFAQAARFSANNLALLQNANGLFGLAVYLSLTTPQGVAATADVYLLGIDLTPP